MLVITIMPSSKLVTKMNLLVFLLILCSLFVVYNNMENDSIYGQLHYFNNDGSELEHSKKSSINFIDMPLKFTVLEQKNNGTETINNASNSVDRPEHSNSDSDPEISTNTSHIDQQDKFSKGFCGIGSTTTEYSDFILEYNLPQSCEMPLGIAVDSEDKQIWYVSTKKGILGMYDITQNKFEQYAIPQWYVRENPKGFSQVWDVKIDEDDDGSDEIWFTDTAQNAIWRFKESTKQFETYRIPGQTEGFGTTYPITINIVTNKSANEDSSDEDNVNDDDSKYIYFIGTFVPSLWYADINDLKNGTTDGIHEINLPVGYGFKNIDPFYVTSGSFEFDKERNSVWISMLSYSRKDQILEYDLDSKSFNIFGLPDDLSSPLGIVIGDNSNPDNDDNHGSTTELWITNPGTSTFYNYEISEREDRQASPKEAYGLNKNYDLSINKYTTSIASPRIFGIPFHDTHNSNDKDSDNETEVDNLSNKYYTLPSWIKKSSDGSVWFNQQQGNKISRFDPSEQELVEYWIPSQNNEWGNCEDKNENSNGGWIEEHDVGMENCGIANVLNFALLENNEDEDRIEENSVEEVWFTEWSTNKIGRIDVSKDLPFDIEIPDSDMDLTVKREETEIIKMTLTTPEQEKNENDREDAEFSDLPESNYHIMMTAAGTFTSTGHLGNSSGYFDEPITSFATTGTDNDDVLEQEVSFVFTPNKNMIPGNYTLMLGAEDNSVSISKAVKVHVI